MAKDPTNTASPLVTVTDAAMEQFIGPMPAISKLDALKSAATLYGSALRAYDEESGTTPIIHEFLPEETLKGFLKRMVDTKVELYTTIPTLVRRKVSMTEACKPDNSSMIAVRSRPYYEQEFLRLGFIYTQGATYDHETNTVEYPVNGAVKPHSNTGSSKATGFTAAWTVRNGKRMIDLSDGKLHAYNAVAGVEDATSEEYTSLERHMQFLATIGEKATDSTLKAMIAKGEFTTREFQVTFSMVQAHETLRKLRGSKANKPATDATKGDPGTIAQGK